METVRGYYNGETFVPDGPVKAKVNQVCKITILDEVREERSRERALEAIEKARGMLKGANISSEAFMARKEYEKSLEL